ncbi:MAG: methyltransferase [Clostridiales bacterium]|jgi:tRNA1Val (adenine37-N6)-methyltransferase|nr:methyltransferase [Clostridiales bacterium]
MCENQTDDTRIEDIGDGISVEVSADHGFGMDAILLAAFAAPKAGNSVCDLGTGCGIIPLLWCRTIRDLHIDAVEIQPAAAEMVRRSVRRCRLESRVTVHQADLRQWNTFLEPDSMDVVTMNPPYFAAGSGGVSRSRAARIARHEGEGCSFAEVADAAHGLLRRGGRFSFCHRPERLPDVMEILNNAGLKPDRLRFVHATPASRPSIFLCEATKGGTGEFKVLPPFFCKDEQGKQTKEYKELYRT